MAITIQVKREYANDAKNLDDLLAKLDERYGGMWVAILDNGDVVADKDLGRVHKTAKERSAKITFEFHAHKKGQLFYR
jgi:hypothetical protein